MPLSPQLKSEMAGDASQKKERDQPVIEPLTVPDFSSSKDTEVPHSEADAVPPSETSAPASEQMALLLSIESQLKRLSDDILGLRQVISASKNPDFRAVFDKIDAARMSLEKLLPAGNVQPAAAAAETGNSQLLTLLQSILEKQEKNDRQLAQSLKYNADFQIQVRQGMQHDLDKLKEQVSGEQYNPILKEIASVYVDYQSLLDDETITDRSRKNLCSLFEQLEDVLSDYGAEVCRSEIGSVRQTRICKIIEKIPTGQPEKHNTIAASRKPGVVRERSILCHELVDVFIYDPSLTEEAAAAVKEADEGGGPAACEISSGETTDSAMDLPNSDN